MEFEKLSKTHRENGGPLFSGISADCSPGESIVLLGASGQGKSTLLRLLAWLDTPDRGVIRYRGRPQGEWKAPEWRRSICYVAQHPVMLPGTVEDNLRTVSRLHRQPFDEPLARRLMEALSLGRAGWSKPAEDCSGGEKQRIALVRSLLLRPELLLLDEVTASLDPHSRAACQELLQEWRKSEGCGQVWITHDLAQAEAVASRVWFLSGGTLREDTPSGLFFREPRSPEARSFLGLDGEAGS